MMLFFQLKFKLLNYFICLKVKSNQKEYIVFTINSSKIKKEH